MGTLTAEELAARLPDPSTLWGWWQSLATLDAIMSPEWDSRYFSFDAAWSDQEQMASMRNGSGDDCSVTFTPEGAYLRGFDHESPLSPWARTAPSPFPGLLEAVPAALQAAAHESAWQADGVTCVTVSLWRLVDDVRWHAARAAGAASTLDDGSDWLFELVDGNPDTYRAFAEEYYEPEQPLDPTVIEHVFARRPLTVGQARRLNPDVDWDDLKGDLKGVSYPTA